MKKTLLVCSSNRLVEHETQVMISSLLSLGAGLVEQRGSSDVAFARNMALTMSSQVLRDPGRNFDTVLMVDDDMYFTVEVAQQLVNASRESREPCSAQYVLGNGKTAAREWKNERGLTKYLTGLGCLAVPKGMVLGLHSSSPRFSVDDGKMVTEFTYCKSDVSPFGGGGLEWVGEDLRLCMRLGGVRLCPLKAAHIKKQMLTPKELLP